MPRSPHKGPTPPPGLTPVDDAKGFDLGITTTSKAASTSGAPTLEPESKLPEVKLPTPSTQDSMMARLNAAGFGMARRRPHLVGALVSNPTMSDETVIGIAQNLQKAVDWTDMRTAAGGVPGLLYDLRAALLSQSINPAYLASIKDQAKKDYLTRRYYFQQDALRFIEEVQKYGPNDQSLIMAVLSGHPFTIPAEQRSRAGQLVEQVTGAERYGSEFGMEPGTRADVIHLLFPEFDVGLVQRTEDGNLASQMAGLSAGQFTLNPFSAGGQPTAGNLDYATIQAATTFGKPFELAGLAGGTTLGAIPVVGGALRGYVGGMVRGTFRGLEWSGDLIIKPALKLAGVEEGDPGYDGAHSVLQFAWQAFVLDAVGKGAHASKVSGAAPDFISRAELNLTGTAADYFQHPITRLVWDIRNKSPQEWLTDTRSGRAFIRDVVKLKEEAGDPIAKLSERYGGQKVPAEMARVIADTPIEDLPRALVDLMTEPGGKTRIDVLNKRLDEVNRQLEDNHKLNGRDVQLEQEGRGGISGVEEADINATFGQALLDKAGRVPLKDKMSAVTGDGVKALAQDTAKNGGATWNPRTGEFIRVGDAPADAYGVAVNDEFANIARPDARILREAGAPELGVEIDRVLTAYPEEFNHGSWIGTWLNEADGKVYVDPMRVVIGKEEALLQAAKTGQKTIFDYATGEEIPVPQALIDQFRPKQLLPADIEISLRAEKLVLEEAIRRAPGQVPTWRFPKKNILRASLRHPVTRWERVIATSLKPAGKIPEWFIDELPTFPTLYSPTDSRIPNWLDHNADVVSKWMRRTGVEQSVIELTLRELLRDVKTGEDFYGWMRNISERVNKALPKRTPPELRAALTEFWNRPAEARTRSVISRDSVSALDGSTTKVSRAVLHDDAGNPLPSMPTEFARSVRLPSVDHAIEATSSLRRGVRSMRKIGYGKLNLGLVYDVPKFFLQLSTTVFKPLVLIARLPALVTRIQAEQFVRAWLHEGRAVFNVGGEGFYLAPGGIPIPGTQMRVLASVFGEGGLPLVHGRAGIPLPENVGDLGMMMSSLMDLEGVPQFITEAAAKYNTGGLAPKQYVFHGWADTLLQLHNDRLVAEFLRHNLDVNAMTEFVKQDWWGQEYMKQQRPLLEQSQLRRLEGDAQLKAWLELKKEQILQQTARDPELLNLLKTGKIRVDRFGEVPKGVVAADDVFLSRYVELRDRMNTIEDAMGRLDRNVPAEQSMLKALDVSRRRTWRDMKQWETKAKEKGVDLNVVRNWDRTVNADKLRRTEPITETKRIAQVLRDKWNDNTINLPDYVTSTQRVVQSVADPSIAETASRMGDAYQRIAYSPLKALTKADIHLTRGSLYYDYYRRSYSALERQGWAKADIEAQATLHAAERVSNIMYDLGAKTSIQRSLKDIFWFAPAWQEIIYTWGVKIPSQYHWPIGVPLIAAKGQLLINLLRETGVIQKNAEGEDVVPVPLGPLSTWLAESGIKTPDTAYFRTQGLNFVTSGGVFPGLSNAAGFLLGKAAMRYGGVFKELSDVVQPFGPETQLLPTPIVHAYELFFGKPPGFELFSQDWQKAQFDRTSDVALQYAYTELAEKDIHPPRITDFKSDAKYKAAFDAYWDRLFSLKDQYLHGMMVVKLAGSTVTPASLSYTSRGEAAWKKFWNTAIEPGLKDGFGEEERQKIDDYLARHPNSLAYATFFTAPGTKTRELPFSPSQDDNVWDEYYTGERRYKTPEEFALTLAISESRRYLVAQLDKEMAKVGDTASEQLRNGYARAQAVGDYLFNWDRFKELTPGAEDILKEQQALFAERYGIPVKSYEQERLAQTINYLNHISAFFTNEVGMRTDEVKSVLGDLKRLYADTGEFGEPQTQVEKQRAWYFENVLTPYIERTSPLYEKAQMLDSQGLYAGDIYDKIRRLNNSISAEGVKHGGEDFPTPEEVFFGNRSPEEQKQAILTWATRPPAWLSDYQRSQVGLPDWEGSGELLNFISKSQANFYEAVKKFDLSSNSKDYEAMKKRLDQGLLVEAQKYGKQGVKLLELQTSAPYVRLEATVLPQETIVENYGQNAWNKWRAVTNAVDFVNSKLEAEGLSTRGNSGLAIWYKTQLYGAIAQFGENQPQFRNLMRDLEYALPLPNGLPRRGALLFNAVFFNNFDTQYVPEELAQAGKGVI